MYRRSEHKWKLSHYNLVMLSTLNACTYAHTIPLSAVPPHRGLTFCTLTLSHCAGFQLWQKQGQCDLGVSILVARVVGGAESARKCIHDRFSFHFELPMYWSLCKPQKIIPLVALRPDYKKEEEYNRGCFARDREKRSFYYIPHRPWYYARHAIF